MKSTSAADVIIQPLWPGPGDAVRVLGAVLLMYASRSATRAPSSAFVGVGAAAGAALSAALGSPHAGPAAKSPTIRVGISTESRVNCLALATISFLLCERPQWDASQTKDLLGM